MGWSGKPFLSPPKAHVMRQQQQHEALCRQVEDLKEEMKTKVRKIRGGKDEVEMDGGRREHKYSYP